jgi:uncharacterized protein
VRELIEFLARELVDDPDSVQVTEAHDDRGVRYQLRVAPEDMGKVIGRGGRTARAMRLVVQAAARKRQMAATVDIVD